MDNIFEFTTTNGGEYIYDKRTSTVIPINKYIYKEICSYSVNDKSDSSICDNNDNRLNLKLKSANLFVERWIKVFGGFLNVEEENRIVTNKKNNIQNIIEDGGIYQLILNVTEDCNFRCKYCYLSESYDYTRNRTQKKMDFETGKKALLSFFDYLKKIKKKVPSRIARINFYGGEPLLEIDLIKKLVCFIEDNTPVPIEYNITTNGFLLNEDIIDFLVAKNFRIAISLDGSKNNHDINRVLSNNTGTHQKVLKNISLLQKKYPNYNYIGIISVYDYNTDLEENIKFFNNNKLPRLLFLNQVSTTNTNYYDKFTDLEISKFYKSYKNIFKDYIYKQQNNIAISDYLRMFVESRLMTVVLRNRLYDIRNSLIPYTSACIPGNKVSIRTDGTIDMCERVNQNFPIGTIECGLDFKKIVNIINDYNKITDKCSNCIASNNCSMCFAFANDEKEYNLPTDYCDMAISIFKDNLVMIYSILEKNNHAFDKYILDLNEGATFDI